VNPPERRAGGERLAALEAQLEGLCARVDRLSRRVDLLIVLTLAALGLPGWQVAQKVAALGLP